MPLRHIRQRPNERRTPVQALRPLDARAALLLRFMNDLLIEFEERFDVVAREGDGDEDQVGVAFAHVGHDGVGGLGAQPGGGAHLGLPAEAVGVGEVEARHHGVHGGGDFGGVGVAWIGCSLANLHIWGY